MAMTVAMLLLLLPRTLHITTCLTGVLVTVCVGARSFVVVPSECCCLRIAPKWNASKCDGRSVPVLQKQSVAMYYLYKEL